MKKIEILNVKIDKITVIELLSCVSDRINSHTKTTIFTINNEFIVEAQRNLKYREILNNSTFSVADSTGVVWAIKRIHHENIKRIPGADLFIDLINLANQKKYKIFLLGGSSGVGEKTAEYIRLRFSNIQVDYIDGIKISEDVQDPKLISQINDFDPDMLLVALGSPKQELWINNNKEKLKASLYVGLGGTFDFTSGKIQRAPKWMRDIGLEWLYRLIMQPSRARRIFKAIITFPLLVLRNNS